MSFLPQWLVNVSVDKLRIQMSEEFLPAQMWPVWRFWTDNSTKNLFVHVMARGVSWSQYSVQLLVELMCTSSDAWWYNGYVKD